MRHVAPHLWADFVKLPLARQEKLAGHAEQCARCAGQRKRVAAAQVAFTELREQAAPEVEWDHVGARIHWTRSIERRTGSQPVVSKPSVWMSQVKNWARRQRVPLVAAAASITAIALVFRLWPGAQDFPSVELADNSDVIDGLAQSPNGVAVPVELADGTATPALWILTRGDVTLDGRVVRLDEPIVAGDVVETGAGAAIMQFGPGSGLALSAHSRLEFVSLDETSIELKIEGGLDVSVSERAPGQQFVVVAGARSLTVRGTAFRVRQRDGDLDVSCEHGRVDILDPRHRSSDRGGIGESVVTLNGRQRLVLDKLSAPTGAAVQTITQSETAALSAELSMPLLTRWNGAAETLMESRALRLDAKDKDAVVVDGQALGVGALSLRVGHGRHQFAIGARGDWARGVWLDIKSKSSAVVGPGVGPEQVLRNGSRLSTAQDTLNSAKTDQKARSKRAIENRKRRAVEVRLALKDRSAAIEACVAKLARHGVASGLFAEMSVSVATSGAVTAVNIGKTNLSIRDHRCVLAVVGRLSVSPGSRATVKARWAYSL